MRWRLSKLNWSYGLGELIIVIVGVLTALSVDQWNSDRLDRLEEGRIVEQLTSDLNTDLMNLANLLRLLNSAGCRRCCVDRLKPQPKRTCGLALSDLR